jgi:hypothetical protein
LSPPILNEPDGIKTNSIPMLLMIVSGIFPESFMSIAFPEMKGKTVLADLAPFSIFPRFFVFQ